MKRQLSRAFMGIGLAGMAAMNMNFTSTVNENKEVPNQATAIAPAELTPLNSLSELDITATEVQFKNVQTGRYINFQPDPRGGGVLITGPQKETTPWYFYQAANAEKNNVEIKRTGMNMFNVSPYDMRTDQQSFIAYNHAKRQPNNTTPAAPHAFSIEEAAPGIFHLKWNINGKFVEDVDLPTHIAAGGTGSKVIVKPADANNKAQQWQIFVNKKANNETLVNCEGYEFKVSEDKKIWQKIDGNWTHIGDRCEELVCHLQCLFCRSTDGSLWRYNGKAHDWTLANTLLAGQDLQGGRGMLKAHWLTSANGKHFLYMQENGDVGIWTHDPDPKNIWASRTSPNAKCSFAMQTDGNLVIYDANHKALWASETQEWWDSRYNEAKYKPVKLVLEDDGRIVLYSATGYKVWDNINGKYALK